MLIDITRLLGRALQGRLPTGVDRVSLEHVLHFGARARALVRFGRRWVVPGYADSQRLFEALLDPDGGLPRRVRWLVGKSYALDWRPLGKKAILLNTGHSGLEQADYGRQVRRHGLRPLYFLHDLIPITHPEYCRPGEADKHRRRLETMLSTGCGLAVNSATTGAELEAYVVHRGLPLPPLTVAPLAPGKLPPPAAERLLAEPYFVMLGTIEPRKNHLLLLHLWRQLIEELGEAAPRLVIIGQRGWECEQVVDLLERCEALRGFVFEPPQCGDQDLVTWLFHAQALLFPSFAEGYGMPLVEALSLGVPAIASDLPVFRELAGDIPDYLDPLDGLAWKRAILDYASSDGAVRRAQCTRLAGWKAPTWAEHFERIEELMSRCFPSG